MELTIFGAGGHSKVIIEIVELLGYKIVGVIEEGSIKKEFRGYPILSSWQDLPLNFIIAIGDNKVRKRISENLKASYVNIIHPRAIISNSLTLGKGTVIMGGVTINADVQCGNHVVVNTNASIDHDCVLDDFVHISPNASLAGNVRIGEGTHLGIGACVIEKVSIGKWCKIGAGAVIIDNIPDGCTVVGNPGRIIKNKHN